MTMAKFTVDGINRLLIAKAGVTDVNVKIDLYSDAKEHWLTTSDNKFFFPFRTVGGDPVSGTKFLGDGFFLVNGWKIRPDEVDHQLLLDGNLFVDQDEIDPRITADTLGPFTVEVLVERSTDARIIDSSGNLAEVAKLLKNRTETNPNTGVMTVFDDDDSTPLLTADIFEDVAGTQPYQGKGIDRKNRLT